MISVWLWLFLLGLEGSIIIYSLRTKENPTSKKHVIRLVTLALFSFLLLLEVVQWGFQWIPLFILLLVQGVFSVVYFVRNGSSSDKTLKSSRIIIYGLGRCLLLTLVIIPAIIFPQYEAPAITGPYTVSTESYTLTDPLRIESFSDTGEPRKVSVQFWYPENPQDKEPFPLVLFSHGAFGFRDSNHSTFLELASHGYVVASIDHTYHSFFTKEADGNTVLLNRKFMNDAIAIQSGTSDYNEQEIFDITHEWLKLRTEDINLVLDTILDNRKNENPGGVFQIIDTQRFGLFGHSLGGAAAAELGRQRSDIGAVIVVDGTMLGEEIDFLNGEAVLNQEPYPVPLLNIYNEQHYADATAVGEKYGNILASTHAANAHNVVFQGSGHLNFTDLPLSSPFLARLLGTGEIDSRYCIETMNEVILNYFDFYLKGSGELALQERY